MPAQGSIWILRWNRIKIIVYNINWVITACHALMMIQRDDVLFIDPERIKKNTGSGRF